MKGPLAVSPSTLNKSENLTGKLALNVRSEIACNAKGLIDSIKEKISKKNYHNSSSKALNFSLNSNGSNHSKNSRSANVSKNSFIANLSLSSPAHNINLNNTSKEYQTENTTNANMKSSPSAGNVYDRIPTSTSTSRRE